MSPGYTITDADWAVLLDEFYASSTTVSASTFMAQWDIFTEDEYNSAIQLVHSNQNLQTEVD